MSALLSVKERGDQIGESLAYSSRCFNDKVMWFFEGMSEENGHVQLLLPELESGVRSE
jgi:hypothetical protein